MTAPPELLRLLLLRHAQTAHNRDGLVQGRADNPLSELGQRQAAALAERLSTAPLEAIYSSPLVRARQTAEAIAAPHGLGVAIEPDLIEMDIGAMEGLSGAELRERFPEFMKAWLSQDAGGAAMPGGESLAQVQARAMAVVERVIARHPAGVAAVVSHNFVLLTVLCAILGLPLHEFRRLRQGVASLAIVEVLPGQRRLVSFNDLCHLEAAGLLGEDPWHVRRGLPL
ncbi:MAG TPA: histidine phosphatase family protein [Dehalococcoidia bacterium]|nr:histidine phosphatase family protein [Dehalococcoidia bacterium]